LVDGGVDYKQGCLDKSYYKQMDYVETTTTNSKIAKRTERCRQIKCDNKKRVPHQCRNVQMQQLKHDT